MYERDAIPQRKEQKENKNDRITIKNNWKANRKESDSHQRKRTRIQYDDTYTHSIINS